MRRRLLLLLLVLLAGGASFFVALLSPVDRQSGYTATFVILPGESLRGIAGTLHDAGVIRNPKAFAALALIRGRAGDLKAGPYRASSAEWAWDIMDRLVEGSVVDTSVTVVEGSWLAEVAARCGPLVAGGQDSFFAAARDTSFLRQLGVPGDSAEGYLFPDTYRVIPGADARSLVRRMVETFFLKWRGDLERRAAERGVALQEIVTLASIVESEARIDHERPRIAAVYWNRLAQGVPLQADPTVSYAHGRRLPRTEYAHLELTSPYNTYVHAGLPPGPIGNPGIESLRSVLWPTEGSRDLYFVATGDGTHLFAPDFEGHRRNRRLVREVQSGLASP